jgi:hypothetical protein
MAKYAQVENGIVVNISVAEADFASERGLILATAETEIGGTYDGSAFARRVVTDDRTDAQKENDARSERDGWLKYCDWTVMPDSPLSDSDKTAWQTYRQALRDVPAQAGFPDNITWPTKPEAS